MSSKSGTRGPVYMNVARSSPARTSRRAEKSPMRTSIVVSQEGTGSKVTAKTGGLVGVSTSKFAIEGGMQAGASEGASEEASVTSEPASLGASEAESRAEASRSRRSDVLFTKEHPPARSRVKNASRIRSSRVAERRGSRATAEAQPRRRPPSRPRPSSR